MKRAKIFVIEGTDGSGKETQSKLLLEYYEKCGYKVKLFSFPVYNTATGKVVGGAYLGKPEICDSFFEEGSPNVDPLVSSLYYAADRRYNFLNDIEKEIYKNDIIILDRYTTSNMGHQAGKAKNTKQLNKILDFIVKLEFELCELPYPDKVVFLHMPLEATKELRKGRAAGDGNENSDSHLKNAENTYLKIYKKFKWKYINCIKTEKFNSLEDVKTIEEIHAEIINAFKNELKKETIKIDKMTRF